MAKRNEVKKALIAAGFEVYRTLPNRIQLADRVRDNLIMDSGVSAGFGDGLSVRCVLKAQRSDFPGEPDEALFERVRELAAEMRESGYREVSTEVVTITDPGERTRTLDTWFEVAFERDIPDVDSLCEEIRRVLPMERTATPTPRR